MNHILSKSLFCKSYSFWDN